jgi:hypothetical protein
MLVRSEAARDGYLVITECGNLGAVSRLHNAFSDSMNHADGCTMYNQFHGSFLSRIRRAREIVRVDVELAHFPTSDSQHV